MNEQDRHDLFCKMIACHYSQLYAYIFAIVRNREDAGDVFQSACVVLWQKFESFQPGSSFFSWARQTVKLVARNFLRHKRKLPNYISEELLDVLAETIAEANNDGVESYLIALRCKAKLSAADQELLDLRYVEDLSSREIAHRLQRPQPSVCHSLTRIRQWLLECIRMDLARQEHSAKEDS